MLSNVENVSILIDAWKLMTGRFPGSTFKRAHGTASTFANIMLSFFNISFQDRPAAGEAEFLSLLSTMRERARGCPHDSMIGLCQPWLPEGWRAIAEKAGFAFALNMTGMAAEKLLPQRRPPPQLEFRRVQDDKTARDLAMINAQGYGMPQELWECLCNLYIWQSDTYAFVGYRDGRAVSTAAALPIDKTGSVDRATYIALVATVPDEHGRGYAEAVMREAIRQGQSGMGNRRIVLHASDMGQPLYRSMGFGAGCQIPLLTPQQR
jgi:ribosomal protein S18 acetylase RimI-like enzyme